MKNKSLKYCSFIKPLDICIFIFAVTVTFFLLFYLTHSTSDNLKIYIDTPNGNYVYDLETDQNLAFKGPLGTTYITIKNKEAKFTDSPCPNKTCVHTSAAKKNGDWIACLPNRIFLRIEGKYSSDDTNTFDAISE